MVQVLYSETDKPPSALRPAEMTFCTSEKVSAALTALGLSGRTAAVSGALSFCSIICTDYQT